MKSHLELYISFIIIWYVHKMKIICMRLSIVYRYSRNKILSQKVFKKILSFSYYWKLKVTSSSVLSWLSKDRISISAILDSDGPILNWFWIGMNIFQPWNNSPSSQRITRRTRFQPVSDLLMSHDVLREFLERISDVASIDFPIN